MAIPVLASSAANAQTTNNLVITKPTGLAVGDLMVFIGTSNSAINSSAGWSQIASNSFRAQRLLWTIADADDVAASNFTFNADSSKPFAGSLVRITGAATSDIFTVSSVNKPGNTASPSFTNGITPAVADSLILAVITARNVDDNDGFTDVAITTDNPASWSLSAQGAGDNVLAGFGYADRPETTATGAYSCSLTSGDTTNSWVSWIVSVAPAAVGGTSDFFQLF